MDTTTYEQYRDQMSTGDLIACAGVGVIPWAIRAWTHAAYSHVGLLIRLSEAGIQRVFLLHALFGQGVVLLPLSRYLSAFTGRAWWVPLDHIEAVKRNLAYQEDLLSFSMMQLGRGYDLNGIAQFVVPFWRQSQESYFCSELAADAMVHARLLERTFVNPVQLVQHPIYRLAHAHDLT